MCFFIIWNVLDDSRPLIKSFLTATLLAAACSHLSLLRLARLDRRFAWTRTAAFACFGLLAAMLLYILWFELDSSSDLVPRILGVLAILVASVTVITPVFHKLSSAPSEPGALQEIDNEIERLQLRLRELEAERVRVSVVVEE